MIPAFEETGIAQQSHRRGRATIVAAIDCDRLCVGDPLINGPLGGIDQTILPFATIFAIASGLIGLTKAALATKIYRQNRIAAID